MPTTEAEAGQGAYIESLDNEISRPLHVAVGVIQREGQVLLARRPQDRPQGGLWEFPGGKVEAGESAAQALCRELDEELGIAVRSHRRLGLVRHLYPGLRVLLEIFLVDDYDGEARGREGQPLRWCPPEALDPADFPEANRAIIRMLGFGDCIAITGPASGPEDFLEKLQDLASRAQPGLIQLRPFLNPDGSVPGNWLQDCLRPAIDLCRKAGKGTLVNGPLEWLEQTDAEGYHASSRRLMALRERPVAGDRIFAASCHSLDELRQAEQLRADFALLSPVRKTRSHPESEALGWPEFRRLSSQVDLPVYALGGLGPADLRQASEQGARGIAAIGAFWGA